MPSLKAKKLEMLTQEKVVLNVEGGSPIVSGAFRYRTIVIGQPLMF
jgi:hypothetical protein